MTWLTDGVLQAFDQHAYVEDPNDIGQSNLAPQGYVYYPNQCADGSLEKPCKL